MVSWDLAVSCLYEVMLSSGTFFRSFWASQQMGQALEATRQAWGAASFGKHQKKARPWKGSTLPSFRDRPSAPGRCPAHHLGWMKRPEGREMFSGPMWPTSQKSNKNNYINSDGRPQFKQPPTGMIPWP